METLTLPASHVAYPGLPMAEVVHTEDHRYLLLASGRVFQIGETLYLLITYLQSGLDLEAACAEYRRRHPCQLREEDVDGLLRKYLGEPATTVPARKSYIYGQVQLLPGSLLAHVGRPFQGLFASAVLGPLLALVTLLLAGFVAQKGWFVPRLHSLPAIKTTLLAYVGVIVGILIHELGHSVAALRYGMAPKGIGFGFYLVFPVFFADVTDVWVLPKSKRIITNLGGVYFQGLFTLLLIGTYYLLPAAGSGRELLGTVVTMNLFVMLYSLNPFLRNDGYWVYADLFNIPNLMHRAVFYPLRWLPRTGQPVAPWQRSELPLLLYSLANYGLFVYLLRAFWLYSSHTLVPHLLSLGHAADFPANLAHWPVLLFLLKTFGLYGFMLYMTVFSIWRNYLVSKAQ